MTWLEKLFVLSLWEPPDGCEVSFTVCPAKLTFAVVVSAFPGLATFSGRFELGPLDRVAAFAALDQLAAAALADRDRRQRRDERTAAEHMTRALGTFLAGIDGVRSGAKTRTEYLDLDRHEC